uniref:Uncharacterized protein n=1 Tax=Oryza sativa subsp. japonica TaxID=39947 RepID=Q67X44_ORYSJ|nr:hypothetical protein [Oryza sativa Japonica Group]
MVLNEVQTEVYYDKNGITSVMASEYRRDTLEVPTYVCLLERIILLPCFFRIEDLMFDVW